MAGYENAVRQMMQQQDQRKRAQGKRSEPTITDLQTDIAATRALVLHLAHELDTVERRTVRALARKLPPRI